MSNRIAPAVLITIPLSHYCEKARWALDRVGLPYVEEPHAPLFHRLATRRQGGGTVPALVHAGQRFANSAAILRYADAIRGGGLLYPADLGLRRKVDALETHFDTELGPHTRRWVYAQVMEHTKLLRSLWQRGVPRLEAPWYRPSHRWCAAWSAGCTGSRPRVRNARSIASTASSEKWTNGSATAGAFWSVNDSPLLT